MRITCPACEASYDVPEAMLAKRRVVRCARCGVDWSPPPGQTLAPDAVPAAIEPDPEPPAGPDDDDFRELPDPVPVAAAIGKRHPPEASRGAGAMTVAAGWLASFVLLALVAWAAVHWRHSIVAVWPASARAYLAIGLTNDR